MHRHLREDQRRGFLTDRFPDAYEAVWDFRCQVATSRNVPHVWFTGIAPPRLMGTAPSARLLAHCNQREGALIAADRGRVPPLALPPEPSDAILGSLSGHEFTRVAGEAARTAPPRENGGNQDIEEFTKGRECSTRSSYRARTCRWPVARFSGTSVTLDGEQRHLDSQLSRRGSTPVQDCRTPARDGQPLRA